MAWADPMDILLDGGVTLCVQVEYHNSVTLEGTSTIGSLAGALAFPLRRFESIRDQAKQCHPLVLRDLGRQFS